MISLSRTRLVSRGAKLREQEETCARRRCLICFRGRARWVEPGDSAAGIANKAMSIARNSVKPGDLSGGVDAPGGGLVARCVEGGESAAGIANKAMIDAVGVVRPGDRAWPSGEAGAGSLPRACAWRGPPCG